MDIGRKYDFEDLAKAIDTARSVSEREHYERIAHRIIHESAPIQSLRSELILAFRSRDMVRVKQIEHHIQQIKLNETYGKNWGNNKNA